MGTTASVLTSHDLRFSLPLQPCLTRADPVRGAPEAGACVGGRRHHNGVLHAAAHLCEVATGAAAVAGEQGVVAGLCRGHIHVVAV